MTAKAATKPVCTHPYVQVLTAIAIGIAFGTSGPATGAAMKPLAERP